MKYLSQTVLECVFFHLCVIFFAQGGNHGDQFIIKRICFAFFRQSAAEVFFYHRNRTGQQVAQVVCKVNIDAVDKRFVGEVTVRAEWELTQQEVTQCVYAVTFCQNVWVNYVALGFAHLAAVQKQPAMTVNLLWQRQIQCHQDSRPDDGMETNDLFTNEVYVSRPVFFEIMIFIVLVAQSVDVVGKSVNPNINNMSWIKVNRNAPAEGGTGNAQILKSWFNEVVYHLVDTAAWLEEVSVFQQILNAVCIFRKTEEVCFLLSIDNRTSAVRALAVYQLGPRSRRIRMVCSICRHICHYRCRLFRTAS